MRQARWVHCASAVILAVLGGGCALRAGRAADPPEQRRELKEGQGARPSFARRAALYLQSRALDTADLFGLKAGVGFGNFEARAQVTQYCQLGATLRWTAGRVGIVGRKPVAERLEKSLRVCCLAWKWDLSRPDGRGQDRLGIWPTEEPAEETPPGEWDLSVACSGPPLVFLIHHPGWSGRYLERQVLEKVLWPLYFLCCVCPTVSAEFRLRPGEVGDWLAGWAGYDPNGDDPR